MSVQYHAVSSLVKKQKNVQLYRHADPQLSPTAILTRILTHPLTF